MSRFPTSTDKFFKMTHKQKRIIEQLEDRALEYSSTKPLSVFSGTWNVNGKEISSTDITEWLLPTADLYVIGLQEMVKLDITSVVLSSSSSDYHAANWTVMFGKALNAKNADGSGSKRENYSLLIEKHMVGIYCCVFVRDALLANVSDVRFSKVYTGGFGLLGNKGGIAVHIKYIDSPICFLFTHFHAKRSKIEARNSDYRCIYETTNFTSHRLPYPSKQGPMQSPENTSSDLYRKIYEGVPLTVDMHDHIIWSGDLNYRIKDDLTVLEIFDAIDAGDWKSLRDKDQLNWERDSGKVFHGFEEGELAFPPTYKYKPNTTAYACRPGDEKKIRAPAWCDRILWKSRRRESVELIHYNRGELIASDHRPVSASFQLEVRTIQDNKLRQVYQEVLVSVANENSELRSASHSRSLICWLQSFLQWLFCRESQSDVTEKLLD